MTKAGCISSRALEPSAIADAVTQTLQSIIRSPASLHEPTLGPNEERAVAEAVRSGWVSSAGPQIEHFETMLRDVTGVGHVIATVNGTAALHACLEFAGAGTGREVIVPALTFVATANAVAYTGATPHFADCETERLGVDPDKLEHHLRDIGEITPDGLRNRLTGRPIVAVVCMHTFGHPSDTDGLAEVCRRHGLILIEDAAEALGTLDRGRHVGHAGTLSALSFNGNKIVTTGGGGAVMTNDPALGEAVRHFCTTGKRPHRWAFFHDRVAYNYRMPNLNAALGCAQLERLEGFVSAKRSLADNYAAAFANLPGASIFREPAKARSNYWLNALVLDRADERVRDLVLEKTNAVGIHTRPIWEPMHRLPMYASCPRMDLSATEDLHARIINLPSSAHLVPLR